MAAGPVAGPVADTQSAAESKPAETPQAPAATEAVAAAPESNVAQLATQSDSLPPAATSGDAIGSSDKSVKETQE